MTTASPDRAAPLAPLFSDLHALLDRSAVAALIQNWGRWRDTQAWAELAGAFAADAWMKTTWFDGPAQAFVAASRQLAVGGASVQHSFGASDVAIEGARALANTRVELLIRGRLHGVEVDVHCWGRFIDRLVRDEGGRWRIQLRVPVYEKDRLQPVLPGTPLALDPALLDALPPHYRFTAYMQSQSGAQINQDLPPANSEGYRALEAANRAWLEG